MVRFIRSRYACTVLVVLTGWVLLAGCTPHAADESSTVDPAAPGPDGWIIDTPPGLLPATLFANGAGVLVGGKSGDTDPRPLMAYRHDGGWQDIPASATTGYGATADIVHLALSPDQQIVAIGSVTGGAHLNPRWSAWIGSTAGVTEEPQTVETFGGPDAGGITGVVSGSAPLVVGTWSVSSGVIGVSVWQHSPDSIDGQTWARQPSPAVLAGSAAELTTATATASIGVTATGGTPSGSGPGVVIAGLATSFRDGATHQQAIAWTSAGSPQTWRRLNLSSTDQDSPDQDSADQDSADQDSAAQDSAATDVACAAGACVVVGRLGDRLAAWRLDPVTGTTARIEDLPEQPVDRYLGEPRVGIDGATTVIAPGANGSPLLVSGPAGWTALPVPGGEQRQVGVHDGTLYLLLRLDAGAEVLYTRPSG